MWTYQLGPKGVQTLESTTAGIFGVYKSKS